MILVEADEIKKIPEGQIATPFMAWSRWLNKFIGRFNVLITTILRTTRRRLRNKRTLKRPFETFDLYNHAVNGVAICRETRGGRLEYLTALQIAWLSAAKGGGILFLFQRSVAGKFSGC
jgi:hypothetical protein